MPANREELPQGFRPSQIARRYQVCEETVIGWIRRGELRALNLAKSQVAKPRFLVTYEALMEFEQKKLVPTPAPKTPRRRRPKQVKDFFPDLQ